MKFYSLKYVYGIKRLPPLLELPPAKGHTIVSHAPRSCTTSTVATTTAYTIVGILNMD